MTIFKALFSKLSIITLLSTILTSSAFATGGQITFTIQGAPIDPTAVPTLSGTMLVILSLLLFTVAFRIAKQKNASAGKFFIALLGVSAIASGSSGIKMISEVNAGGGGTTIPSLDVNSTSFSQRLVTENYYTFSNPDSNPTLTILIEPDEDSTCGLFGTGGPVCSDILAPDASCTIACRATGGPEPE